MRCAAVDIVIAGWLAIGLSACAEIPPTGGPATAGSLATSPPTATAAAQPSPPPAATIAPNLGPSGLISPTQALRSSLVLADQEMNAAGTSSSLQAAQQHAQLVVDIYVGAWGRWYAVGPVSDPAGGHGVFPGERVPGPAPDAPGAELPLGWGFRAYDLGDVKTMQAVEAIMGDVAAWRANPRAGYDEIETAVNGSDQSGSLINKLRGHATRAVAWARLISVKATTLAEAQQFGEAGRQETSAALAAAGSLPPQGLSFSP